MISGGRESRKYHARFFGICCAREKQTKFLARFMAQQNVWLVNNNEDCIVDHAACNMFLHILSPMPFFSGHVGACWAPWYILASMVDFESSADYFYAAILGTRLFQSTLLPQRLGSARRRIASGSSALAREAAAVVRTMIWVVSVESPSREIPENTRPLLLDGASSSLSKIPCQRGCHWKLAVPTWELPRGFSSIHPAEVALSRSARRLSFNARGLGSFFPKVHTCLPMSGDLLKARRQTTHIPYSCHKG